MRSYGRSMAANALAFLQQTGEAYEPRVVLTGVSYKTLNVDGRERLARAIPVPELLAERVVREGLATEAAVISTCNRFEIVSVGGEGGGIRQFFEALLGSSTDPNDVLYQYLDDSAIRHLYRVSSSLDSMILGEAQILGQVKKAYHRAIEVGSVGSHLHHIFQSAFNVAKKVRAHTDVSQHGVSVSYVAVRLAEQIFSDLQNTTVLIIGSGEMAELAALHLCSRGCRRIIVANRTVEKAAELAERFGGSAVSLSDVDRVLDQADIVIGSISIDKPVLSRAILRARKGDRPLFLIDLGVPRNFASDLAEIDSVYLYNIDDLAGIADENRALREAAAQDAELIIEYGLAQFERWRLKRVAQPEIVDLRAAVHEICATEVNRILASQSGIDEGAVAHLSRVISQKIAHELTKLVEHRVHGESESAPLIIVPKG
ncbi:MAG: glutamyl-tRNA reductase [Pseudomonadota bacterium]